MSVVGELWFLAFGGATLIGALLCYVAARFALLSDWTWVAGVFRLLALWLIAAWMGYGTPLYVALATLPLALVWRRLSRNLILLLVLELGVGLCLAWHSQTPLLPINVAALLLVDQCLGRFALLRFNTAVRIVLAEPLFVSCCVSALSALRFWAPISSAPPSASTSQPTALCNP